MIIHFSFRVKNNRYGFCMMACEQNYSIAWEGNKPYIIFGLYVLYGHRFANSKKVIEWIKSHKKVDVHH